MTNVAIPRDMSRDVLLTRGWLVAMPRDVFLTRGWLVAMSRDVLLTRGWLVAMVILVRKQNCLQIGH